MVLLKQSSRSVLYRKFPESNRKTPLLECLFKKLASQRPAALLKGNSSTGVMLRILRDFLEDLFVFDYHMLCKRERLLFVLVRIGLLLMFWRIHLTSVFKVFI